MALNKPIWASSIYAGLAKATNANNGLKNCKWTWDPDFNDIWHSNEGDGEWITVDLEASTFVKRVVVYERTDLPRLNSYVIHVGDHRDHNRNPKCAGVYSSGAEINCGLTGRYVSLVITYKDYTHVCELEVYSS
mmetsp:Transcript_9564/g.7262  ORF Transcript_9564/g.7262 Transcript_9564/m.7262 type:complete len:134 (-) Transcript_9564:38-439(-)